MGQYCFCTLTSVVVVVCNAAGNGRVGTLPAVGPSSRWVRGRSAAGRVGGQASDSARRASTVTSH